MVALWKLIEETARPEMTFSWTRREGWSPSP